MKLPSNSSAAPVLSWSQLPPIPDHEGFAGSFVGAVDGALFVAGGANFPDKRPWEGGTKCWHDQVYLLEPGSAAWMEAGRLPVAGGYGASISWQEGLLLIGGGDATRHFRDVWCVRRVNGALRYEAWPALPQPLSMHSAALVGERVYVTGGIDRPDARQATKAFYALDLNDRGAGWRELQPWPGPERLLAAIGEVDGSLYLASGVRLVPDGKGGAKREWLCDAYRYDPGAGWQRLPDPPHPVVAAPVPCPTVNGSILVLGGDDGSQIGVAPPQHRGFPRTVLALNPNNGGWKRVGEVPFSLVTTTLVNWCGRLVVAGGEARPGVRSPHVWAATVV